MHTHIIILLVFAFPHTLLTLLFSFCPYLTPTPLIPIHIYPQLTPHSSLSPSIHPSFFTPVPLCFTAVTPRSPLAPLLSTPPLMSPLSLSHSHSHSLFS